MKKIIKAISITLAFALFVTCFTACNEEKKAAEAAYQKEVERLTTEANDLNAVITECDALIATAAEAYDPETMTALETATTDAKASIISIPEEMPSSTEEINAFVNDTLSKTSYTETTAALSATKKAYEDSVKVLAQITNPSQEFVVERIKDIPGITGYDCATEDNDPNGKLGKSGGYTAAIYFEYDKVDISKVYGDSIIERGTDGGGQIEVYANNEDAENRKTYLSAFDGTMFSSGSHTVVGSCLVRTSDKLKASEQKELEANIIAALIELR